MTAATVPPIPSIPVHHDNIVVVLPLAAHPCLGILRRVTRDAIRLFISVFLQTNELTTNTYLVSCSLTTNLSPMHCASWPLTQAVSPAMHLELVLSPWNCWLRLCASRPFWSVEATRRSTTAAETVATARESRDIMTEKRIAFGSLVCRRR
jgi:hypothetical protein